MRAAPAVGEARRGERAESANGRRSVSGVLPTLRAAGDPRCALIGQLKMIIFQIRVRRPYSFDCFPQTHQLLSIMARRSGSERQIGNDPKNIPAGVIALAGA
jgi:hypothetical protein